MKKRFLSCILILMFMRVAVAAEKPLGVEEFSSIDDLAGAIAAHFPKVQGEVNAVGRDTVTLTLGKKDGVSPGMTLTLWRVSKEILHPITNAVIGRTEEEVGTVEITTVAEDSSTAVIVKKMKDPRTGDKARITPRKINLAVIPVKVDSPEIPGELTQRLSESGRFSVLETEKSATFLKDRKELNSGVVTEMGKAFSLDAVIALSVFPTGGKLLVTAKIYYADDGRLLDAIEAMLAPKSRQETLQAVKPYFAPVREERAASPDLPFAARLFVRADLDGDGALEYAFSDGSRLHIYRQDPTGWKEIWTEVLHGAEAAEGKHVSLDAADINGNGRPELFATSVIGEKVVTAVTEWQDGAYRRIAEVPAFLRVVTYPGKGPLLIGLEPGPKNFYSGQPRLYSWSGNTYVPGAPFPLPAGVHLYGFAFADFGESRVFLVSRTDDNKLMVYTGDTPVWKSEEEYPGADIVVLRPQSVVDKMTSLPASDPSAGTKDRQMIIKGRVLALDIDGDGKDEIILPKNSGSFLFFDIGRKADLRALRWTGVRLEDRWSVRDAEGEILDLEGGRESDSSARVRALVRSPGGIFTKETERVIMYLVK